MNLEPQEGVWWFPADPSKRFSGTLTFDPADGGRLKLTVMADRTAREDLQEYKVIYGKTAKGQDVTLVDCFDSHISGSSDLLQKVIFVNLIYLGFLLPQESEENVREAIVHLRFLNRWFRISGIEVEHHESPLDMTVFYRTPAPITASLPEVDISFRVMPTNCAYVPSWDGELTIQEKVYVRIETKVPSRLLKNSLHEHYGVQ